jgi:DNA transformation protein
MGDKGSKSASASAAAAEDLLQRLIGIGDIRTKKMFGGHGIFFEDKMFALIDNKGGVFFKVDETNLAKYEKAGAQKHGRMPYFSVPQEVLHDDETLPEWAQISIHIAKQAK